jgi:hypothetical protein
MTGEAPGLYAALRATWLERAGGEGSPGRARRPSGRRAQGRLEPVEKVLTGEQGKGRLGRAAG